MAYDAQSYTIRIDGTTAGSEVWANTWTFHAADPGADIDDAVAALLSFYGDLAGNFWTAGTLAVSASWRQLNGNSHGDGAWVSVTGTNAGPMLPPECAIRVSLSSVGGTKGGPFLTGFRTGSVGVNGIFSSPDAIATFVGDMAATALSADWALAIDKPTTQQVAIVSQVRVGEVFDVIRKRRNDLPENYAVVSL